MRPLPPLLVIAAATNSACHAEPKPKAPDPAWAGFEPERPSRDGQEASGREDANREPERELPLEIPVDPRRGPPDSYVEVVSPNWAQAGVGLFVFGVSYAPLAFASSHLGGNAWTMQVPIVGPFLQIGETIEHFRDGGPGLGLVGVAAVGLYFVGLVGVAGAQTAGVIVLIDGLVAREKRWIRSDFALVESKGWTLHADFRGDSLALSGTF